jgi:hypothetical protein
MQPSQWDIYMVIWQALGSDILYRKRSVTSKYGTTFFFFFFGYIKKKRKKKEKIKDITTTCTKLSLFQHAVAPSFPRLLTRPLSISDLSFYPSRVDSLAFMECNSATLTILMSQFICYHKLASYS